MRDHTKLRAFQLADELALATYKQTCSFPREEIFGLGCPLDDVRGNRNRRTPELTAYGSAREVEYQVGLAFRLGFLSEPSHRSLSALSVETSKVLNGLLRSLRK